MGRQLPTPSTKQLKKQQRAELAKDGGLIRVSFSFDGKNHVQTHRLTQAEMDGQMALLRHHGVAAFTSATLQVSIWGAGQLGRHVVEEAFKEYARKNYVENQNLPTAHDVVDALITRHEERKQLAAPTERIEDEDTQ